jgi:hypothetical protein
MFVEFENMFGTEGNTNAAPFAPFPIDLNVHSLSRLLFLGGFTHQNSLSATQ